MQQRFIKERKKEKEKNYEYSSSYLEGCTAGSKTPADGGY